MVRTASLERLTRAVEGALPEDAELVEARFSGGPLLTLLVDNLQGPVDHEFTGRIAGVVSPVLEDEGYEGMIEVSSPGIERPLTRPAHFERFTGHEAKVRTARAVDEAGGRRNFTGVIAGAGAEGFTLKLEEDGREVAIGYADVTRAVLKEDVDK